MLSLLIHLPKCFTFEDIVCIIWNFLDGTNWTKIIKPYGRVLRLQDAISFIENPSGTAENTNRCKMGLSTDMSHPSSSQQPFPHTHPPPFLTPQLLPVFRLIFREVSCVVPPPLPNPTPVYNRSAGLMENMLLQSYRVSPVGSRKDNKSVHCAWSRDARGTRDRKSSQIRLCTFGLPLNVAWTCVSHSGQMLRTVDP